MVRVRFREAETGQERTVEAVAGQSLMAVAKAQVVPGIEAICGGSMACGTCHVYVDPDWFDRLPAASAAELEIVDCGVDPRPTSRLACQIVLSQDLDGLSVTTPESQI